MSSKASSAPACVVAALEYAEAVISGEIVAGNLTRLACRRFLADLKRQGSKTFPYVFDVEKAARVCRFIEKLPHIKGVWANRGERIQLEPWQMFGLCNLFGWVLSKDLIEDGEVIAAKGTRRFRNSYWEVARKNAKSTIAAGVSLYMTLADNEQGAECYSAATTRKQAQIVWKVARDMLRKQSAMREYFHADITAHTINSLRSASTFEALHSQGETLDGLNVHFASIDELHAHKTREVYDVLESAIGSRSQPLLFNITTSGFDRSSVCYELRGYAEKVLTKAVADDQFFSLIYTLDKTDDPWAEKNWIKANPNYGVSVSPLDMRAAARKAKETPSAQNNFLTKRLNIWCNAESAWMDLIEWDKCADRSLVESDFYGDPCVVGFDIASKVDLTAGVRLYLRWIDGELNIYCFPSFWLPEDAIEKGRNSQYKGWSRRGLITATPGNVIDMDAIEKEINEWFDTRGDLREVAYDPAHNATQWATHLAEDGLPMVEIRPTVLNFSEPMKWLQALVKDGRFHHDGNEVLSWCISNVVVRWDFKDNIYPRKERQSNLIDGAVALITGINRAIAQEENSSDASVVFV